jgi:predicted exporter
VEDGHLGGYDSPTRVLPSLATQAARRAALPEPEVLRTRLDAAVQGLPFKASAIAPFIDDVKAARERAPLTREALQGTALGGLVDAMLLPREAGGWSVLLSLQAPGRADAEIDAGAVRQALAGVEGVGVVDLKQSLDALYAHYLGEARWQSLLGGVAVLALLALYLRHARRWFAVCLPLGMAVVLTLAGLLALDVRLGILHLVGLLLVVAVGSNYALFFDHLRQHGHTDPDTMASLLLANLTTVISFGLIARSDIAALSAIGVVVAPGALLALLMSAACVTRPAAPAAPTA